MLLKNEVKLVFDLAIQGLKTNRGRTVLTTIGVVIGIATIVIVLSAGRGLEKFIFDQIDSFGGDTVEIEIKIPNVSDVEMTSAMVGGAEVTTLKIADFEAVKKIAQTIKGPQIAGLSRAGELDINRAWEALKYAGERGRIHTFIATSDIHMKYKLKMSEQQVLDAAVKAVELAASYTPNVEFSAEDAVRTRLPFLAQVIEAVIASGATTVNIPDTVGYTIPSEYFDIIGYLKQNVSNIDKAIISVHCHNDLGMAVANSLQAVMDGARQVECTINGLGERAGNAALEEIVMAVRTRQDFFPVDTNINISEIVPASRLVSGITGFPVQPNKAIVGANAFAHESGIHQDGVIKKRETYEIMRAEDVGWSANRMVMGKHSGRNAFRTRLKELGTEFNSDDELNSAFSRFKDLADKKEKEAIELVEKAIVAAAPKH